MNLDSEEMIHIGCIPGGDCCNGGKRREKWDITESDRRGMIEKVRGSVVTLVDAYNEWINFFTYYLPGPIHILSLGIFILLISGYILYWFNGGLGTPLTLTLLFCVIFQCSIYMARTPSSELSFVERESDRLLLRHSPFRYAIQAYYFTGRRRMIGLTPLKETAFIGDMCDYSIENIEKEEFHPFREMLTDRVITELEVLSILREGEK